MDKSIIDILRDYFTKIASIAFKANAGDITPAQSRELATDLMQNTGSKIYRHRVSSFVTDN